jgi:hypothetical protein
LLLVALCGLRCGRARSGQVGPLRKPLRPVGGAGLPTARAAALALVLPAPVLAVAAFSSRCTGDWHAQYSKRI